jgi:hypothetical protein
VTRDFELIRTILLIVEAAPANAVLQANSFIIDGYEEPAVLCHIALLLDAGMLFGKPISDLSGITGCLVKGLTWSGYEFLDAVKTESVWSKLKELLGKQAISIPGTVLAETGKALLSAAIPKLL